MGKWVKFDFQDFASNTHSFIQEKESKFKETYLKQSLEIKQDFAMLSQKIPKNTI